MVSHAGCKFFSRRSKSRPETPRTETPLGQNTAVTARANVAERGIRVETVAVAAAPRTYQHALGNRLATINTLKNNGNHGRIAFYKCQATHFLPVELLSACRFQGRSELEPLGDRLEQGRAHLLSVRESLFGIDRKSLLEKSDERQAGFLAEALASLGRPMKRPSRQNSGQILVQNQANGETIAAVGGPAVCLLRSDVTWGAEVIHGCHSALEPQTDSKIAECGPAVRKQENVAGRYVAVNHALSMGIGQAVEDLCGYRDNSAHAHGFRAIIQRADRKLGRKNGLAADNIGVLNRHNVWMAKLCYQADFAEQGLVIPFAVHIGQRYLQGHPDALDGISCFPDLAASPLAEAFCQPVLAQLLPGFEVQA